MAVENTTTKNAEESSVCCEVSTPQIPPRGAPFYPPPTKITVHHLFESKIRDPSDFSFVLAFLPVVSFVFRDRKSGFGAFNGPKKGQAISKKEEKRKHLVHCFTPVSSAERMRWSSMKAESNLERFLRCVTPRPPSISLPPCCKSDLNSPWQAPENDEVHYFKLGELWECYGEWSAFGVGMPVELKNGEIVMQYYVPYLSAIQIYINNPSRNVREDNEAVGSEIDSWSDDSVSDKLSRSLSGNSSKTWDGASEDSSAEHDSSWVMKDKLGNLNFQHFEICKPYLRIPLADQVVKLTGNYPPLMSLRSVDLSPASWMAVAWYPIYHIPFRRNEKDLLTSFLTYHTLSSSFQDDQVADECVEEQTISLAPFGLATYKMQGDVWRKPGSGGSERLLHLYSAADSWLKQLNTYHHDFNFFTVHSTI